MKRACLLFVLLLSSFLTYGQEDLESRKSKFVKEEILMPSSYIFEGTILETVNYIASNGGAYTSATVQIHKVFKGDLKPGTVELLTLGQGEFIDPVTNQKTELWIMDGGRMFAKGQRSVFAGTAAVTKLHNFTPRAGRTVTNPEPVLLTDFFYYPTEDAYHESERVAAYVDIHPLGPKRFSSIAALYRFLLEVPGTKLTDFDNRSFEIGKSRREIEQELGRQRVDSTKNTQPRRSEAYEQFIQRTQEKKELQKKKQKH